MALILEGDQGVCGYTMGVLDSRTFFEPYEREWRPQLCQRFPKPTGPRYLWTRAQSVYHMYRHPDYFFPEPYEQYPSHLHIDILERAQGQGHGRRMIEQLLGRLRSMNSPEVHLGMSADNEPAYGFYVALGFQELLRQEDNIYMGMQFG